VRSVRHYLGAFLLELGGLDVLTFSGGIGENSPEMRSEICARLESFGVVLDRERNDSAHGQARICATGSPVAIFVLPTDEEWIVARATAEVINGS
jgi:acetate kinase